MSTIGRGKQIAGASAGIFVIGGAFLVAVAAHRAQFEANPAASALCCAAPARYGATIRQAPPILVPAGAAVGVNATASVPRTPAVDRGNPRNRTPLEVYDAAAAHEPAAQRDDRIARNFVPCGISCGEPTAARKTNSRTDRAPAKAEKRPTTSLDGANVREPAVVEPKTSLSAKVRPAQYREWCERKPGDSGYDLMMRGCTAMIQAGNETPKILAVAFNARGNGFVVKKDYDRAVADFSEAIRLDPADAAVFRDRATAYAANNDADSAIRDYTEAARLDPRNAIAFHDRGLVYQNQMGDMKRAIADYTEALRLDPRNAMAYTNRGHAYSQTGDFDRALADYNEAIKLNPDLALAYNYRGGAFSARGNADRAIADYTEALRRNPKDAVTYANRGRAYSQKGDADRAIQDYNAAIMLDPNNAVVYVDLAARIATRAMSIALLRTTPKRDGAISGTPPSMRAANSRNTERAP